MTSPELENLVRIGRLKREPPVGREQQGLLDSADARLADAAIDTLSFASRFVPAKAHERRNLAEYEGHLEHDERLLADLIDAAGRLRESIRALPPVGSPNP